ncbi:MAG: hypothetical protein ACKVVT_14435 [Dehalococcoidia bacterium]
MARASIEFKDGLYHFTDRDGAVNTMTPEEVDAVFGDPEERRRKRQQSRANFLVASSEEVWDRYPDSWIAVEHCQVVAVAPTWQALFAQMDALGLDRDTAAVEHTDSARPAVAR